MALDDDRPPPSGTAANAGAQLRAHPRYPAMWRARMQCQDWAAAEQVATKNVSEAGMFLATTAAVPYGTRVELTLELPSGEPAVIRGTVRHVVSAAEAQRTGATAGVGIEIGAESQDEMRALAEIARLHQQPARGSESPAAAAETPPPRAEAPTREVLAPSAQPSSLAELVGEPDLSAEDAAGATPLTARQEARTATSLRAVDRDDPLDEQPFPAPAVVHGEPAPIVGFDLGVSYSGVSVAIGDVVQMIPDAQGRTLFPSLVAYPDDGPPRVGWEARALQETRPDRVIASAKRLLGYKINDRAIGGYLQNAPFHTAAGPDDAILFEIDDKRLAVPQVCALLLEHLYAIAEAHLGARPEKVVLNVPVAFRGPQREALQRAAWVAKIELAQLLDEPLAGALAYGCGRGTNEIIGVFDFGGGTFDFTVLDMSRDQYRVLVADGDPWLGGDDFDLALAEAVANAFWRRTQVELRNRMVEWQRLILACEQAKRRLSEVERAEVRVPEIVSGARPMNLVQAVDRAAFQRICHPLLERALKVCQRALERLQLDGRDLTTLVVTGGTSRIPFVRAGIEAFFEREVEELVSPDHAIALGAGLHAARLAGRQHARALSPP